MRGRILFAFAGDADERPVERISGHVIGIGICTAIQKRLRNRQGVVVDGRKRQPRVAQIQEGFPIARPALCVRELRPCRKDAFDLRQIATDNSGVEVLARDLGMLGNESHRGCLRPRVLAATMDAMIPAREFEECCDARCRISRRRSWLAALSWFAPRYRRLQRDPAFVAALASERMLDVSKSRLGGGARVREAQALLRSGILPTNLAQPMLRFFPEIVEGAQVKPSFRCAWRPLTSGRKKVLVISTNGLGGSRFPLPRTGGAPTRAEVNVADKAPRCQDTQHAVDWKSKPASHINELGPRKIRVNALNPRPVATEGDATAGFVGGDSRSRWCRARRSAASAVQTRSLRSPRSWPRTTRAGSAAP